MSEINLIKSIAPDSNRIQRTKQSNRQGGRPRHGAEEQFHERLQERIEEHELEDAPVTQDTRDDEQDADRSKNEPDGGLESTRSARQAAKLRYPSEIGRNTDITA